MNNTEKTERFLNYLSLIFKLQRAPAGHNAKWFLCFGTLLNCVRDKGKLVGDFDLGMLYEEVDHTSLKNSFNQWGFQLERSIINNADGKPLFYSFMPKKEFDMLNMHVDVFFWFKHKQSRYHTYDVLMEKPKDGRPSKYILKGVPDWCLEGNTWEYRIPDHPRQELKLPNSYGHLLDIWYPNWVLPDPHFGTSRTEDIIETTDMRKLP